MNRTGQNETVSAQIEDTKFSEWCKVVNRISSHSMATFLRNLSKRRRKQKGKMTPIIIDDDRDDINDELAADALSFWQVVKSLVKKSPPPTQSATDAVPEKKTPKTQAKPRPRTLKQPTVEVEEVPPVTIIHGPPPRFTGGPSTWTSSATKGKRYKALVSHSKMLNDELGLRKGDLVIVEEVFEDGWVRVFVEGNINDRNVEEALESKKGKKVTENGQATEKRSGVVPFHYLVTATEDEVPFSERKKIAMEKMIALSALQTH